MGIEKQSVTMFDKYKLAKARYVNHIVFLKTGDFYETYDEDARKVSKILGITLATRGEHLLSGFPCHCGNAYAQKIEDAGFLVAFVREEQIKDLIKKMEDNMKDNVENKMEDKKIDLNKFKHIDLNRVNPHGCYWFNQETATLEQVNVRQVVFSLVTGSITYKLSHKNNIRTVVAKDGYGSEFTLKLYKNEDDYINSHWLDAEDEIALWKIVIALNKSFKVMRYHDGTASITGYTLQNGDAAEINLLDYVDEIVLAPSSVSHYGVCSFHLSGAANIPELNHIYQSKEELFRFESVRIEDNDGKKRCTDAPMARLRLSEEQQKAVDNFLQARETLKEVGVGLIFDTCEHDFYAINANDFKEIEAEESEYDFDDCLNRGVLRIDSLPNFMKIDFDFDAHYNQDYMSVMCTLKDK